MSFFVRMAQDANCNFFLTNERKDTNKMQTVETELPRWSKKIPGGPRV